MVEDKDETKAIADGDVVRTFLENPVIKAAWERVEKKYFAEFLTSDKQEDALVVHARARALVDVAKELRAVKDNGERAHAQREFRAGKKPAR